MTAERCDIVVSALVDLRRIELRLHPCHGRVIPFHYRPFSAGNIAKKHITEKLGVGDFWFNIFIWMLRLKKVGKKN